MKQTFLIINIIFITIAAYFAAQIFYKSMGLTILYDELEKTHDPGSKSVLKSKGKQRLIKNLYEKINRRNIFNALLEEESKGVEKKGQNNQKDPEKKLEASTLKLKLWGTVTGGAQVFAVIEDQKTKEQSLYQTGDTIQDATIKGISRQQVILTYQGKDQVLEMDITQAFNKTASSKSSLSKTSSSKAQIIDVHKDLIDKSLEDQVALQRQVRVKPHYKNGEPDGLILYGIRPKSIFNKMGLKNGDIIKEVNGTPAMVAEDAFKVYDDLDNSSSSRITIFRRGQRKEIVYHVKYGARSIMTFPGEEE